MPKATTIRFSDEVFARLDQASARTGLPVNSIVVAACLEWMQRHAPEHPVFTGRPPGPPRWSTIRRAVAKAVGKQSQPFYPFERFTETARQLLTAAQDEALKAGLNYIGTEHLLLAGFANAESHAARALSSIGLVEATVRSTLEKALRSGKPIGVVSVVPTSRVKRVIEIAFELSRVAGDERVSTGHILLALSTEGEGIAARVMNDLGATSDRIESALEAITEPEP